MTKKQILNTLNFIKKMFTDDKDVSLAADTLIEKVDSMEMEEKSLVEGEFPIPSEVGGDTQTVAVFSDGACRGNPGPGAWATMGQSSDGVVLFSSSGVDVPTTNNRMEMEGAIRGLETLKEILDEESSAKDFRVCLYSDSKYVVDGVEKWMPGWKNRGWKKADKKVPENVELWQELDQIIPEFGRIEFYWVKGHSGHPQNEHCDKLANLALDDAGY